jgi:acetylornithine deacetylase
LRLGSNDAGGALVSLLAAFRYFYVEENLPYNLIFAATAEEENSGFNGIESVLPFLGELDFAIVGEPTQMHMAIAEKGLMVLDCTAHGKAGHAAREEGENALYKAIQDIEWFRTYRFPKVSDLLGPVKMSVTQIQAGNLHNMVPDKCQFTVDVRINDCYTHEEILEEIGRNVQAEFKPRSTRIRPSHIAPEHPFVQAGLALGREAFGSSTTSDQGVIPYPSLKMGPGDSARSHTADEYIYLDEIREGVAIYIQILAQLLLPAGNQFQKSNHEALAENLR